MDLAELGKVGKASFLVATVGVIAPMVLGFVAMGLITDDFNTKLFMGAALDRDQRGHHGPGLRRPPGAGDHRGPAGARRGRGRRRDGPGRVDGRGPPRDRGLCLGPLGGRGSWWWQWPSWSSAASSGSGWRGPLFAFVDRFSRSTGTLVAIAFAFALGFARLAEAAKLAPIVGAFVAGIALSKASAAPRISRELAPVGHLFIPVFFLGIGIDADISAFFSADVLREAGILLVVAAVGKLVSPLGAIGTRGDKVFIGLGMLPRGEVGPDLRDHRPARTGSWGTTSTPPSCWSCWPRRWSRRPCSKYRYGRLRAAALPTGPPPDTAPPDGGWLVVADGEIDLAADPPLVRGLAIGLSVAIIAGRHRPTQRLLDWLTTLPDDAVAVGRRRARSSPRPRRAGQRSLVALAHRYWPPRSCPAGGGAGPARSRGRSGVFGRQRGLSTVIDRASAHVGRRRPAGSRARRVGRRRRGPDRPARDRRHRRGLEPSRCR